MGADQIEAQAIAMRRHEMTTAARRWSGVAAVAAACGSAMGQSFGTGFETGIPAGWVVHNQSNPIGTDTWTASAVSGGHTGSACAHAPYTCGSGVATISAWLITPQVTLRNGDSLNFWTRSTDGTFPDRMQIRMSTAGASVNTGASATDLGDFGTLLLDINPSYSGQDFPIGYPLSYHFYSLTVSGLAGDTPGRFAFRYFVEGGGPAGSNSDNVSLDDVGYVSIADPTGACCFPDGSCGQSVQAICTSAGGTYAGVGVSCAAAACPAGACCLTNFTCTVASPSGCTSQNGIYRGDGSVCATANCPGPTAGPDVIVGEVFDMSYDGAVGNISAYSVGTDSCNIGDVGVTWVQTTNQHPVITGNMFRLKTVNGAGRFEQIGLSWFKNGFLATNDNFCGACATAAGSMLGPHGCSDVYYSGLNGEQGNMGPRSIVNGTTGDYPYPYTLGWNTTGDAIYKRCQVLTADIDPAQNAGALYFADAHYLVPDDARFATTGNYATNGLNNYSYRPIQITSTTATPTFLSLTRQMVPGIQAWRDNDAAVTLVNAEYLDSSLGTSTIVARHIVGARATDIGGGQWHYEYAIYNVNSDRSGGSFSVPLPPGAVVTNVGFHAPLYHSGEVYDNTPWTAAVTTGAVTWTPAPYASDPTNANAIRWGTMYTFRFDANAPPLAGTVTLGLFKPGSPSSLAVDGIPVPGGCYPNCDNSTSVPVLNVADFTCFLQKFAAADPYANCDNSTSVPVLNVADFTCFLQKFASGCP
jgi:hypothetical protein